MYDILAGAKKERSADAMTAFRLVAIHRKTESGAVELKENASGHRQNATDDPGYRAHHAADTPRYTGATHWYARPHCFLKCPFPL